MGKPYCVSEGELSERTFNIRLSAAQGQPSREEVLRDHLKQIYERRVDRSSLIKESGLGKVVVSNILLAKKSVGRKTLLAIAFALKLTENETNELLQKGGFSGLSRGVKYDAVLAACIEASSRSETKWTIQKVNGYLLDSGFSGSQYLLGQRSLI